MNQKNFISLFFLVIFIACFCSVSFFGYANQNDPLIYTGPYEGTVDFKTGGLQYFPLHNHLNYFTIEGARYYKVYYKGIIGFGESRGEGGYKSDEEDFHFRPGIYIPLSQIKYMSFRLEEGLSEEVKAQFLIPLFNSIDYHRYVSVNLKDPIDQEGVLNLETKGSSGLLTSPGGGTITYAILVKIQGDGLDVGYQSYNQRYISAEQRDREQRDREQQYEEQQHKEQQYEEKIIPLHQHTPSYGEDDPSYKKDASLSKEMEGEMGCTRFFFKGKRG